MPKKIEIVISQEDIETLKEAQTFYGKTWRNDIEMAWYNGNYRNKRGIRPENNLDSRLQAIRNKPSRNWNIATVKI